MAAPELKLYEKDTTSIAKSVYVVRRYVTSAGGHAGGEDTATAEPVAPLPHGPVPPPGQLLTVRVTRHGGMPQGDASPGGVGPSDGRHAAAPPRQAPALSPPQRQGGRAAKAPVIEGHHLPLILPDEGPGPGMSRLAAYQHCWKRTQERFEAVLRDNHAAAFAAVTEVVSSTTWRGGPRAGSDTTPASEQQQRLPTALVLAGGVNQADHSETFTALTAHLAAHGCCPALLRSQDVGPRAGGGTHPGLTATVRAVWTHLAQCAATQAAAGAAMGPGAHGGAAGDGAVAVPQWPTVSAMSAWYCSLFAAAGAHMSPLVILIEDTECCASDALADLVVALDECRGHAPVALVLGVATSPSLVQALLPMRGASRLHPHIVRLRTSVERLECVQRDVLLGCGGGGAAQASEQPGPSSAPQQQRRAWRRTMPLPLLDGACASLLHTRFVEHDFSLTALRDTLQLAGLLHACTCPMAGVMHIVSNVHTADAEAAEEAAKAGPGGGGGSGRSPAKRAKGKAEEQFNQLVVALKRLPAPLRRWAADSVPCLQGVPPAQQLDELAAALRAFGPESCAWGAAVACVAAAAQATGTTSDHGLGVRELFRDAAHPGFVTSADGIQALAAVQDRISDESALPKLHLLAMLRQWAVALRGCPLLAHLLVKTEKAVETTDQLVRKEQKIAEKLKRQQEQLQQQAVPHRNSGAGVGGGIRALEAALGGGGAFTPMPGGGGASGSGPRRSSLGTGGPGAPVTASGAKQSERNRKDLRATLYQQAANLDKAAAAAVAPQSHAPTTRSADVEAQAQAPRGYARTVLKELIENYLAKPPASLPAAPILVMSSSTLLRGYLQAAPRGSMEAALLGPGHADFLRCTCCPTVLGKPARPKMPDACAAYSLLQGVHAEFVNVHDWFQDFIQLHASTPADGAAAPGGGSGGGAGASRPMAKSKGKKRARQPHAPRASDGAGVASLPSGKVSRDELWRLQARFERALAELRLVGLIRPAKKRRGEYVQRLVFGADTQVGGDGDGDD